MRNLVRIAFLIGMALSSLYYGNQWLVLHNGGMEAWIFLITTTALISELLFNLVDHVIGDAERPRLELEIIGTVKDKGAQLESPKSPKWPDGRYRQQVPDGIYKYTLKWTYNSFIRNNSNFHAFKPKVHLKKKYHGLTFPGLNEYKPDGLYFFKERYLLSVNNIHQQEPIKSGDRYIFKVQYKEEFECTSEEAENIKNADFPDSIGSFEILMEYENGQGRKYYTLFKRNADEKKLTNTQYLYKPLSYRF